MEPIVVAFGNERYPQWAVEYVPSLFGVFHHGELDLVLGVGVWPNPSSLIHNRGIRISTYARA
jgi:hypothetical protein